MNDEFRSLRVGDISRELPKSTLAAAAANDDGVYPFFCSSPEVKKTNQWIAEDIAILMGTGGVASVHLGTGRFAYSTDTWAFVSRSPAVDIRYLFYLIYAMLPEIEYKAFEGSGLRHLRKEWVRNLMFRFPTMRVQSRIADILSTMDEEIANTEAVLAKHQQIKAGIMVDLLTRGVTADGQLRPTRNQAAHLYKESALGWIPTDWEIVQLNKDLRIDHGFAFPGDQFSDYPPGPVLLTPGNFHRNGGLYFTVGNTKYFRGAVPDRTILGSGQMVVVMTDLSPKTLILGRFAIVKEIFPILHNQRIGRVVLKVKDRWDWSYLCNALNAPTLRSHIIREATGTTVHHTSPSRILHNWINRPPLPEQVMIARILDTVDSGITTESAVLAKKKQLRFGLRDDLLTGRVGVTLRAWELVG